ncbi:hypothetical protein HXX76_009256 [Chlamydomonas incerta]|uniref:BACK domain-containing protein n=1 Tax=Chlamydomonas incerta TaxID=51695 RepID=A0A835T3F9_CHLIN|nr:hypothetical protein HXX76_009256 [Chlamydomonas incerta]|eukprot:KAG2431760.1 hypothetical protein HXX76_009256 [Chlamydomonas incerta]
MCGKLDHVTADVGQAVEGEGAGGATAAAASGSGGEPDAGATAGPGTPGTSRSGSPLRASASGASGGVDAASEASASVGASLAAALLHTRRLALYLQMPDCVAACEAAMVDRVREAAAASAAARAAAAVAKTAASRVAQGPPPLDARLAAAADVYGARELLAAPLLLPPPPEAPLPPYLPCAGRAASATDPRAAALGYRVRLACLEQLVSWAKDNIAAVEAENQAQHSAWHQHRQGSGKAEAATTAALEREAAPPAFGELLAWAVCTAPHALTDPAARALVLQLPAAALEAALLAENFATDDESTVLLLLATWLAVNSVAAPVQLALQRLLRLGHMNEAYAVVLLPLLVEASWIALSRMELGLVAQCGGGSEARRKHICGAAVHLPSAREGARWFHTAPRPRPPPRVLDWDVDAAAIAAARPGDFIAASRFASGAKLVANGFEWTAGVVGAPAAPGGPADAVGVFLYCGLPQTVFSIATRTGGHYSLRSGPGEYKIFAHPGKLTLTAFRKAAGDGGSSVGSSVGSSGGSSGGSSKTWTAAVQLTLHEDEVVEFGHRWGDARALPLAAPESGRGQGQGQGADRLGPWEPYLLEGQLRGQLRWGE